METLLRSYAEVHEPIELSFRVVSGVGTSICVKIGVDVLQWEGPVPWGFGRYWFQWVSVAYFLTDMYSTHSEKLTIFPYAEYVVGYYVSLAFQR